MGIDPKISKQTFYTKLAELMNNFTQKTGFYPTVLYIGKIERKLLQQKIQELGPNQYYSTNFMGMEVVEVNRFSYLSVGISNLDV